jgi:ParB-like chromosome segregation protein Spo0J
MATKKSTKSTETVTQSPAVPVESLASGEVVMLPLSKLWFETDTAAVDYDPRIEAPVAPFLVTSVGRDGILQSLLVSETPSADGSKSYKVINGKQRMRAALAAGLVLAPCIVSKATGLEALRLQVKANAHRIDDDLAAQTANAKRMLAAGMTLPDIAEAFGKPQDTVVSIFGIDKSATAEVKALVTDGTLDMAPAQIAARAAPEVQPVIAAKVEALVAEAKASPSGKTSSKTGSRKADARVVKTETGETKVKVSTEALKTIRAEAEAEAGKAPTVAPRKAAKGRPAEADLRAMLTKARTQTLAFPKPEDAKSAGFAQGVMFAMRWVLGEDLAAPAGAFPTKAAFEALFGKAALEGLAAAPADSAAA